MAGGPQNAMRPTQAGGRTTSPEKIVYKVNVPFEVDTETVTNAILALDRKMPPTVKWDDKAIKAK